MLTEYKFKNISPTAHPSFTAGPIRQMISFFQSNAGVFTSLTDAVKTPIQNFADSSFDNFASCWFVSGDPNLHMDEVIRRINDDREILSGEVFQKICESLKTSDTLKKVYTAGIRLYCQSGSFDSGDTRFQEVIKPYIESYSKEHFEEFMGGCETCYNGQAAGRSRATRDHRELKKTLDERFPDIDLDQYPTFKATVE